MNHEHTHYMRIALELAQRAADAGEIPIGAVLVNSDGVVIAEGANSREMSHDPTAHAEIIALRKGGEVLQDWRLLNTTLYVTLEPCPMCAGAISMSRVSRLVIGAWNDEYGAAGSRWDLVRDARLNHQVEVTQGVLDQECGALISDFLAQRRA